MNFQIPIITLANHASTTDLALTETWVKPEDTATPAALSNNFSFFPHS